MSDRTVAEIVGILADVGALYAQANLPIYEAQWIAAAVLPAEDMWVWAWSIMGQAVGHEWCRCNQCGEVQLMEPRKIHCRMTYGCQGITQRIKARPRLTKALKHNLSSLGAA